MSKELLDIISEKLSGIVVGNIATAEQVGAVNQAIEALKSSLGVSEQEPVLVDVVQEKVAAPEAPVSPEAPVVEEAPVVPDAA